jgi:hypothetical protein
MFSSASFKIQSFKAIFPEEVRERVLQEGLFLYQPRGEVSEGLLRKRINSTFFLND